MDAEILSALSLGDSRWKLAGTLSSGRSCNSIDASGMTRMLSSPDPGTERHMNYQPINFGKKLGLFDEQWQPKVIAEMNDYQFKVVKLQGDFIWHDHKNTDETFIVLEGVLRIDFRDGCVQLSAGEMFVVPKGVEHKPYAEHEVKLLLIEPRGVPNTGDEGGDRTAGNDVWI
jgi:mannose-6-phosphate isomerase-like protein (cupin superfamily)